jgi:hypothetical protein
MQVDITGAQRYTLVIGAGVNTARAVPGWASLVQRAWVTVFGEQNYYRRTFGTKLTEARSAVQRYCGWSKSEADLLDLSVHPLEPQFALELIECEIRNGACEQRVRDLLSGTSPRIDTDKHHDLTSALLAHCLYADVRKYCDGDTLSELARFVRRSKRLVRVISLNVDNLLELEVDSAQSQQDDRYLDVISRHRHSVGVGIPTYHIHGFLPINMLSNPPEWAIPSMSAKGKCRERTVQQFDHMVEPVAESLVFTDAQYWQSTATPLSFANFIFANALHDSSCIFIGLSMTDLNIIRWLGLHTTEFRREFLQEISQSRTASVPDPYMRHCWIRSESSDPTGFVTRLLSKRGVHTEILPDWETQAVRKALDALLENE